MVGINYKRLPAPKRSSAPLEQPASRHLPFARRHRAWAFSTASALSLKLLTARRQFSFCNLPIFTFSAPKQRSTLACRSIVHSQDPGSSVYSTPYSPLALLVFLRAAEPLALGNDCLHRAPPHSAWDQRNATCPTRKGRSQVAVRCPVGQQPIGSAVGNSCPRPLLDMTKFGKKTVRSNVFAGRRQNQEGMFCL